MSNPFAFMMPTQSSYDPYGQKDGQPSAAFAFSQMPMFGGEPPRFPGPFNFSTGMGSNGMSAMLQTFMPFIVQNLAGRGRMPAQFFPEQGFYEQMQAQQFFMENQHARQMATQSDMMTMNRTIGGITQMMTGKPLTRAEQVRNLAISKTTSQMMPFLTQMLGPDLIDSLHGSRGSSAVFATQLHSALRTGIDPVTGTIGMSGASAGGISNTVFENLFGDNYNPATLRGMSAGQAGMLAKELQTRGLLGVPIGAMGINERRAAIPDNLSEATINRIARNTKSIRDLGDAEATPEQLKAATDAVRNTYTRMKNQRSAPMTAADFAGETELPGAADLLRTADAAKITNRLKDMSGAVKAMREIFGDMGNPNAPMREIVDGLNKLTQGGLSTMSPGALEMTVRKTQAIAKQTGMSVEGIMALTNTGAQLGDQLGLDRGISVVNGQNSALFAATAARTFDLGSGAYGVPTVERLAAADIQLRTFASASPAANQARAALRMVQQHGANASKSPQLAAYLKAIEGHDTAFDFSMDEADFLRMMEKAGVGVGTAQYTLWDTAGNQEFGRDKDIGGLIRGGTLRRDAISEMYAPAIQGALNTTATEGGKILRDRGFVAGDEGLQQLYRDVGIGFMEDYFKLDSATVDNDAARTKAFGDTIRAQVIASLTRRMPAGTPAEDISAAADAYITANGGAASMAANMFTAISSGAAEDENAKTARQALVVYGTKTEQAMKLSDRQAIYDARMGKSYSGIGTVAPMQRIMDAFQGAGPGGINADMLADVFGQVKTSDVNFANPQGAFAVMMGLAKENAGLDKNDDKQWSKFLANSDLFEALTVGGSQAANLLSAKDSDGTDLIKDPNIRKLLTSALNGKNVMKEAFDMYPKLGSNATQAGLDNIAHLGDVALVGITEVGKTDASGNVTPLTEDTKKSVDSYIEASSAEARQLARDEYALKALGTGSPKNVRDLITYNEKLRKMAADKKISVAELLADPANTDAIDLFRKSAAASVLLSEKYKSDERVPLTEAELADFNERQAFDTDYATDEAKTAAAMTRLLEVMPRADRGVLKEGSYTRGQLNKLLEDPGRSAGLFKAATAKQDILKMAVDRGLFSGKTDIDKLSDEERADAAKRLDESSLDKNTRERFDKLREDSKLLEGLDSSEGSRIDNLQKAIESISTLQANIGGGEDKKLEVQVTGTLIDEDSGRKYSVRGDGDASARSLFQTVAVS